MSKSANMLRTRRKDNNVKPNRRLDRKSSRGMLYENEELRLKTININAEVERGQSDIKKLKRENDQLRREIWYLRDEYDKLDKLLRDKDSQNSSTSTTCTSESESCTSCSEESEAVETSQNIENVQITNLKKLNQEFDHLSIVPEENSAENSEKISDSTTAENLILEKDIIKPDQSYPMSEDIKVTLQEKSPKHFFSPIKISKPSEDYINNQFLGSETYSDENLHEKAQSFFPSLALPSLHKSTTDVIVKTDNNNFDTMRSRSSFSNGGNLEELLNDIESISHDILKISNSQTQLFPPTNSNGIATGEQNEMPYRSELNVVLMPTPMKLIGIEKYKQIQKSCESLNTRSLENLSSSQNLKVIPEIITPNVIISPDQFYKNNAFASQSAPILESFQPFVPVPPNCPSPVVINEQPNPFFYGNMCNPPEILEIPCTRNDVELDFQIHDPKRYQNSEMYSSKVNLLDTAISSDHVSSENEENLRFKTSRNDKDIKINTDNNETKKRDVPKSPTLGLKNKVSIHFKGKKDKNNKEKPLDEKVKTVTQEKRRSIFDIRILDKKNVCQKSSTDSKTNASLENKINTDSKTSKTDSSSTPEKKVAENKVKMSDSKVSDKKHRKSSSASPERKHGHKETKKTRRKHKKSERNKNRRNSISVERYHRERSYSICTDRSNILDHRPGGYSMYDDFTTSDRERTNSLSSSDSLKGRKLSNTSYFPGTGKIPWCGCWGNGCL